MKKQIQPIPLLIAPLLPLSLAITELLTPLKLLAHNHEKWEAAPDIKPGHILAGVNTKTLIHHQLKVKKRKGSRIKFDYILTDLEKKPWDIVRFEEQLN